MLVLDGVRLLSSMICGIPGTHYHEIEYTRYILSFRFLHNNTATRNDYVAILSTFSKRPELWFLNVFRTRLSTIIAVVVFPPIPSVWTFLQLLPL